MPESADIRLCSKRQPAAAEEECGSYRTTEELLPQFRSAKSEAEKAFGIDDIFIEKYLESPKHIEVQVLGDKYGNHGSSYMKETVPFREDIRK